MSHLGAGSFWTLLRALLSALFTIAFTVSIAFGQTPGVTDNSVLIGSCSALDGPAHFLGRQTVLGASAYLHMVNDEGGVFGRKIHCRLSTTATIPTGRQLVSSA